MDIKRIWGNMSWVTTIIIAAIVTLLFDYFVTKLWVTTAKLSIGVGGVAALIIITFLVLQGHKGEVRARMRREAKARIGNIILKKLKRNRLTARLVTNFLGWKYQAHEGELLPILKDLRLEIYTLMNWILRHEIYNAKSAVTAGLIQKFGEIEEKMGSVAYDEAELHEEMRKWVEGGNVVLRDNKLVVENGELGIARKNIFIYELMSELKGMLEGDLTRKAPDESRIEEEVLGYAERQRKSFVANKKGQLVAAYGGYKTVVDRFKIYNLYYAYRLYFLDMYNMYGQYVRGFCFARKDAVPFLYEVEIVEGSDNGIQKTINWESATKRGSSAPIASEPGSGGLRVEVNLFGYVVSDINKIQILGEPPQANGNFFVRRYRKEDIVFTYSDQAKFSEIVTWSYNDWKFDVEDMKKGIWHPYSRSMADYGPIIGKGYLKFDARRWKYLLLDAPTFKKLLHPRNDTAFDREALKNPGFFKYWGRKDYFDPSPASPLNKPANPYPTISIDGLWDFIIRVAMKHSDNTDLVKDTLNNYFRMQYEELKFVTSEKGEK